MRLLKLTLALPFLFVLAVSAAVCITPLSAETFSVNHVSGDDKNPGTSVQPFKTIARAMKEVDGVGGEVHLSPEGGPYRDSISINHGGKQNNPLVVDGHGAVLNLGIDVTTGPWIPNGDGFILDRPVAVNDRFWLATLAFVNGLPLSCYIEGDRRQTKAWHGGSACYTPEGRLRVVFPRGLTPANAVVVLTGGHNGEFSSGVQMVGASYVVVKNLTAAFAANDGFNFHIGGHDIVTDNVKALFNGDNGTSAHETCQVKVSNSEFAFNGSGDGVVEDIQDTVTTYRNIRVHQNRGDAFLFPRDGTNAHHEIIDSVSFGNGRSNDIQSKPPSILVKNLKDGGRIDEDHDIPVIKDTSARIDPAKKLKETDRLGRFLQLRPPTP